MKRIEEMTLQERLYFPEILRGMMVTKRGARLSVQPVTAAEFRTVRALGRAKHPAS